MSEQGPKPNPIRISRRNAAIGAGLSLITGAATFLLGRNQPQNPENPPKRVISPTPIPKSTEVASIEGSPFAVERIRGVDIFGYPEGLKNRDEIKRLDVFLDQQFIKGKTIKADSNNKHEIRLELMPRDQRNLQLFISDRIFSQFEPIGGKDELMRRLNLHVQIMNQMIAGLYPSVNLQAVLKRVVIVKEELLKTLDFTEDLYPLDIDGRWDIKGKGFADKSTASGEGVYTEKTNIDGKEEDIDYGLIHEWFHALFSYPDEYTQNYDGSSTIPALYIEKSAGIKDMSYWAGYFLNETAKRGIRGMYTDPRSFRGRGILSNHPDDSQSVNAILGKRPKNITIQATDAGKPLNISLQIEKEATTTDYYTGKRYLTDPNLSLPQSATPIRLPDSMFAPSKSLSIVGRTRIEHNLYPQGWLLRIASSGKVFPGLHLPAMAINMTSLAGQAENIPLVINFNNQYDPSKRKQVIRVHGPKDSSVKPGFFAQMSVSGTPQVLYWYQE